ncbi:alcohol oxidase [Thozetella sp. PMI_491]|nr:alcohol oxidase [Thozetella sp. PMI_491]
MGLYKDLPKGLNEVDIVIAGGGTAACIVASRLSEADPSLSILVIERGPNNQNVDKVVRPALLLENIAPGSNSAIFYKGNKAPQLNDREPIVPTGGILGGGSSINFMIYTRPPRCDFDSWNSPGWSADELIPFSNKLETYQGYGPKEAHGSSGPVGVTYDTFRSSRIESEFLSAAGKLGIQELQDLQDFKSSNGVARYGRYVGTDGRRSDTAHRYLHPLLQDGKHPNLHVLVEHQVVRVLFDDKKRAVGVEFTATAGLAPETSAGTAAKLSVRARKMVVVSCGALASPGVLERSGIGSPEVLKKASVPVLVDLPGVGHDYQDHHLAAILYKTDLEPNETNDALMTGRADRVAMLAGDDAMLSWNTVDVGARLQPTEAEAEALGPQFKAKWEKDFKEYPDRPIMLFALASMLLGDYSLVPEGQYLTVGAYTAYPYSRGHVHITGPEVTDPIDFETGFFSDAGDVDIKKQVWAYKKQREILRRMSLFRGEVAFGHPAFPPGSKAALADGPLEGEIQDIQYSAEDDEAIEQYLRNTIQTSWHALGTVKMAPREQMGAVDKDLNVYGTTALKVIDLSIPPENVAANTNNVALTIGEKGADIVARELGIELKAC